MSAVPILEAIVQCKTCRHAIPTDHPVLIRCGQDRPAFGCTGTWWSEDWIFCSLYQSRPNQQETDHD